MTDYQLDKEWEQSEVYRLLRWLVWLVFPVLIGMMVLDNYLRVAQ